jgi:hypothetical protein
MILNILTQLPRERIAAGGEDYLHLLSEAARLAYADRDAYVTDPEHMSVPAEALLSERYACERAAHIADRAGRPARGQVGETIYLCAADRDGNLVSLIESNYMGIGSGVMAGSTGIMLQNRGAWFSLDPAHVNVIAPRKRTMHTLMPAMAFREGSPWLIFGTMGGSAQAQIQVELLTRLIDQELPLDEALAAPRFDAVPLTGTSMGVPGSFWSGECPTKWWRGYGPAGTGFTSSTCRSRGSGMLMLSRCCRMACTSARRIPARTVRRRDIEPDLARIRSIRMMAPRPVNADRVHPARHGSCSHPPHSSRKVKFDGARRSLLRHNAQHAGARARGSSDPHPRPGAEQR